MTTLDDARTTAAEIARLLQEQGAWLATVESCTGGLIANLITDIAGSSAYFWGSWVTYDNDAKQHLGVEAALIEAHGAVSPEVATSMAEAGQLEALKASPERRIYCLSTTGIAGPGGATQTKPVGLCYTAVVGPDGSHIAEIRAPEPNDRLENKAYFALYALTLLGLELKGAARPEALEGHADA